MSYLPETELVFPKTLHTVSDAAAFIKKHFNGVSDADIQEKGENSLVSFVDREAEKILVEGLSQILPEAGFITEEEMVPQSQKKYTWIVDPLDGTTNFLLGAPYFSVSVALYEGEMPVFGIVHEVMHDEIFTAITGNGARLNGLPIGVTNRKQFNEILVGTGFPYNQNNTRESHFDALKLILSKTRGIRRFGSAALDLCYVACGRFGAFYENSLNPYDIAAGAVIVREAGGMVTDFEGNGNWLNKGEILASAPQFHHTMLEIMSTFNKI